MADSLTPELEAMHAAMRQAEAAALARQEAKRRQREADGAEVDMDELAELALLGEPVEKVLPANHAFALDDQPIEQVDRMGLADLIAQASAQLPEHEREERHGDLVVMRHEAPPSAWYEEAAEAVLPAAMRNVSGPVDVKALLTALMVEVGDVKRTNAILMDLVTRVDEKVDRIARQLKDRPFTGR